MNKNPIKPDRISPRLKGYDYTLEGAYFFTCVTYHREPLFGKVVDGQFRVNPYGKLVTRAWLDLPSHYPNVRLGEFIVMPNHVHGIVFIDEEDDYSENVGSQVLPSIDEFAPDTKTPVFGLPEIMRAFKSYSSRQINNLRMTRGLPIWQRSFYDRIVRTDHELQDITDYIQSNPRDWREDEYRISA